MNRAFYIVLSLSLFFNLNTFHLSGQDVRLIDVQDLEKLLNDKSDKLTVLHLWATWCAPCIRELPDFQKTSDKYNNDNVRFILVSLDFKSQVEKQLIPFLKKNNITLDVMVMTNTDYNSWIDKIDPNWEGTIPATLIFNNNDKVRYFHSGELQKSELINLINKYSNS